MLDIFLLITGSFAAAAVNPTSIKTLFANGFSTFSTKGSPFFNNGVKSLP